MKKNKKVMRQAEKQLLWEAWEALMQSSANADIDCNHIDDAKNKLMVFINLLNAEADVIFDKFIKKYMQSAYRFHRIVCVEGFMADEMIEIFSMLKRDLPGGIETDGIDSQEKDILNGIAETIEIKIESIKENVKYFMDDGLEIVGAFKASAEGLASEDKSVIYSQMLDFWNERVMDFYENGDMEGFFDSCMDIEFFSTLNSQYDKRAGECQNKVDRLLMSFKKDTLFHEINTYEEILTYSVSRLRGADSPIIMDAVLKMDEAYASLEKMLKKNYVFSIKPAPHDMFNGTEHEVLYAEQQEGFGKGEIIKVLNCGYKYKDAVILRANVIAAR